MNVCCYGLWFWVEGETWKVRKSAVQVFHKLLKSNKAYLLRCCVSFLNRICTDLFVIIQSVPLSSFKFICSILCSDLINSICCKQEFLRGVNLSWTSLVCWLGFSGGNFCCLLLSCYHC
jgi:hypothetical protein